MKSGKFLNDSNDFLLEIKISSVINWNEFKNIKELWFSWRRKKPKYYNDVAEVPKKALNFKSSYPINQWDFYVSWS